MQRCGNKKDSKQLLHDENTVVQHVTSSKLRAACEVRAHVQDSFCAYFCCVLQREIRNFLRQHVLLDIVYLAASTQLKR